MIPASNLKTGVILRMDKNLYKVITAEYHLHPSKPEQPSG
jgi:translation elongation factor P/translation initiation factor 5A